VKDAFYIQDAPVPTGPKALPWLPSRTTQNPDFKMLTQEKFLERLDAVCDSFQPLDSATTYLIEVKGDEAAQSPRAFQLANAEGALSRLVEEAMWSGPIRHMAICVLAQRVIMLTDSIRSDPDNAPGGRELMVALLSSVKQMCAANTGDISWSRNDKFSGRIVLLLGSASCTGEQLLKDCGERYREIDQNCMLIAVSMGAEPAGSAQLGKTIACAVNAWGEAEARNGPPGTTGGAGRPELLIHLFGGAGFAAWAKILKLWQEQSHFPDEKRLLGRMLPLERILKGVVLDSAPGAGIRIAELNQPYFWKVWKDVARCGKHFPILSLSCSFMFFHVLSRLCFGFGYVFSRSSKIATWSLPRHARRLWQHGDGSFPDGTGRCSPVVSPALS
jgi:hypothetical protein